MRYEICSMNRAGTLRPPDQRMSQMRSSLLRISWFMCRWCQPRMAADGLGHDLTFYEVESLCRRCPRVAGGLATLGFVAQSLRNWRCKAGGFVEVSIVRRRVERGFGSCRP